MFIKSLRIGFIGLIVSVATAWAGSSGIQGIVNDIKGRPIKGADIRIEATNSGKLIKTVKTDANGHYISDGLPAGTYRVTLVVNGAVKASINNTKTKADGPTQLNFDLKLVPPTQATASAKKVKHWVLVQPKTGTRIGGGWVEVPDTADNDNSAMDTSQNIQTMHGTTLQKLNGPILPAPPPTGR
jgi:Carboxypeptidase regulatory-like domain